MRHFLLPLVLLVALAKCGPSDTFIDELDADVPAGVVSDGEGKELRRPPLDPCSMTGRRGASLQVLAHPDVGEEPYLEAINRAQRSLRVMVYQLTSRVVREAIRAKAAAGVEVRVILDQSQMDTNQTSFNVLTAAGAKVQWSDPQFTYTHAKFLVVDDAIAIVSTGNYDGYMRSGRNFAAIDRDAHDVETLASLFDADWQHVAPNLTCTRLLVSPVNARARHLELLRSAHLTLTIESMQFSDSEVRQAVLERKRAGVAVRVLLAAPSWISANESAGAWLKANGIDARWRSSPSVHVKTFVVDGHAGFLGSENLSRTSLSSNREVGLVTTESDDLELMSATFEKDWATATAF